MGSNRMLRFSGSALDYLLNYKTVHLIICVIFRIINMWNVAFMRSVDSARLISCTWAFTYQVRRFFLFFMKFIGTLLVECVSWYVGGPFGRVRTFSLSLFNWINTHFSVDPFCFIMTLKIRFVADLLSVILRMFLLSKIVLYKL